MASKFPRIPVDERARRYVALMPPSISGSGGHTALFNVVRTLLHGFGFSADTARPIIREYNQRCDPPWSDHEIEHKLRSVDGLSCPGGRGYLLGDIGVVPHGETRRNLGLQSETERKKSVEFDPKALEEMAGPWAKTVDLLWLANRSAYDPATVSPSEFLAALYHSGEKVLCFTSQHSQGEALWPDEKIPATGREGVWFLPQPVDGKSHPNPRSPKKDGQAKLSRRSEESVTSFRYMLLESDKADLRHWLGFIVQAPLAIDALYTSGGRSIHALVRVECATKKHWDAEKQELMPFLMTGLMLGADRGTWSAVRLSRLPGCFREGKYDAEDRYHRYPQPKLQKLLYLRPWGESRPICERPAIRDVEGTWINLARLISEGHTATADGKPIDESKVIAALNFYAPVSKPCRAALEELNS
ncbi:MAG TPA: hypothetical protein VHD61_15615 [Lacunisphaera sp.]|nr:hypothetical protein [Lacunisphaera sp.]